MDKIREKHFKEINEIVKELHNKTPWGGYGVADKERLDTYSNFLSAKSNEELLKTIRNYNKIMIGFGIFNLVLTFINLYLLFK